jgi:hypothetical protein
MNMRPMRLWSVVVNHSAADAKRAPDEVAAPVACVSMVVIGGELFSFRARWCAPDAVLDRLRTIGLHLRDYP